MTCVRCAAPLTFNESGLNRKFNAGAGALCIHCLAQKLNASEERLKEKMEEYRKAGCLYFSRTEAKKL